MSAPARLRVAGALLFSVGLARAQAPPIEWELVGTVSSSVYQQRVNGITFRAGAAPDGSADTLYTSVVAGFFRYAPGAADWALLCGASQCSGAEHVASTREGYLLIGSPAGPTSGGERSVDGGRTWENDVVGTSVVVLYQSTLPALGGAVYACNLVRCYRSFAGGAAGSWEEGGLLDGEGAALGEVRPSAGLPEGRLLGGVWNGAVYSDDGGLTWTPSSLWGPGRFVVNSLTFVPDAAHPFGGAAFAGVRDFAAGLPAVYRSGDGGQTWQLVRQIEAGEFGLPSPDWTVVRADTRSGGAVYLGIEDIPGGTAPSLGTVLASWDGGQTWAQVGDSTNGWGGFGVNALLTGRDGRLYAATDRGVWRTVSPLPVANESVPLPDDFGGRLEVHPNPFRSAATVTLMLVAPQTVRLAVFDELGREVAMLLSGTQQAGKHEVVFDASALKPGVYLVRAEADGQTVTRALTVLR